MDTSLSIREIDGSRRCATVLKPVSRSIVASLVLALSSSSLVACVVSTDLNVTCALKKRARSADGGFTDMRVPVLYSEISANRDFIALGATDCEDLVCVRDSQADPVTDMSAPAMGYCSRPCTPGNDNPCPSQDSSLDKNPKTKLSCRALLLSDDTLSMACSDPVRCAELGGTRSPYYCARGTTVDAGM